MVNFEGPEAMVGRERVIIDEEKLKLRHISDEIAKEFKMDYSNPFKQHKESSAKAADYSYLYEDIEQEKRSGDWILREIADFNNKLGRNPKVSDCLPIVKEVPEDRLERGKDGFFDIQMEDRLPIYKSEFEIMDSINSNLVTVISGETGTGKSTQLPQILHQYGYTKHGMIGITQPRRLAAISLANRVSQEMTSELGDFVGYQVRFEKSKISSNTKVKFMTDGILLNEMVSDFLLNKYTCIIIDEAHERSINSDILIGLLSRVIRIRAKMALEYLRKVDLDSDFVPPSNFNMLPLRLVIMSATLETKVFLENKRLFPHGFTSKDDQVQEQKTEESQKKSESAGAGKT